MSGFFIYNWQILWQIVLMKKCTKCLLEKPLLEYGPKRKTKLRAQCRECERKTRAKYVITYPDKVKESDRKHRYKINNLQWQILFKTQENTCAICKTQNNNGKQWHTDHNHETGQIRGILCQACNLMLGHAKDQPTTLIEAAAYLRRTDTGKDAIIKQ